MGSANGNGVSLRDDVPVRDDALADAWIKIVDVINVPLYEAWQDDTRAAIDNIRNRTRYMRLDEHGPKLGPITKQ